MRHAKSSWDDPALSDHERPLNKRGRASADAVATALHARGYAPELIWSSDAQRTRETAERMIRKIPGPQTILVSPEFYHASPEDVFQVCESADEPAVSRLMLLGHNPGWALLYDIYAGSPHDFPTGACAVFKRTPADAPWYSPDCWKAVDLILPRELLR